MSRGSESGVRAVGAYLPRLRVAPEELASGWGEDPAGVTRAVPDADEDALTMAVAAGRQALAAADATGESVDRLVFATTTPPVEEGALTARLGAALSVPESASRSARTADAAAGVRALRDADEREGRTLVVAADCPRGAPDGEREAVAGAGGAAFLLEPRAATLRVIEAAEASPAYPGTRFRRSGDDAVDGVEITAYDRTALREAMAAAAADLDTAVDAAAVQAPGPDSPYRAAGALGVERDTVAAGTVVDGVGDAAAASVPLSLALTLARVDPLAPDGDAGEDPPETLLAAGYGGDGAALLRLERSGDLPVAVDARPSRAVDFAGYLRRRADVVSGAPEGGGAHVSVPAWRRSLPQRYRLAAGRCPDCEAVSFPPGGACDDCGAVVEYEPVDLDREGTVETAARIAQGGAPPEFREYQRRIGAEYATAVARFSAPGGGEASVPLFVVDDGRSLVDGAGKEGGENLVRIGAPVEAVFRRIYTQEGVTRYGLKLRPLDSE
ncbi:ACP synthase [Halobacteriales archaeon SW_5_70_135]|nr:MAG: ACP synthase [Halobacteriales archaeon SW_5_70_135]